MVLRAEQADPSMAAASGLLGDHLGDVQARQRQAGPRLFEGTMRGVVRAGEEAGTSAGEPVHAYRQRRTDRVEIAPLPCGQDAG